MMDLGFTGTREGLTEEQVKALTREMLHLDPTYFHHGMCIGADEQAHRIAMGIGCKVHGHPPKNETLLMQPADFYLVWTAKPYLERNKMIVEATEQLVACPKGPETSRSGTWSTVRYARKLEKPITIIWPNGNVDFEQ